MLQREALVLKVDQPLVDDGVKLVDVFTHIADQLIVSLFETTAYTQAMEFVEQMVHRCDFSQHLECPLLFGTLVSL